MCRQGDTPDVADLPVREPHKRPIRLLIAPMAVAAETGGPFARARALAVEAQQQGHVVAFAAADDPNYRPVDGITNYGAPLPSPYGTPLVIGKFLFRVALFLFRYYELPVTSFEQALHIIGATAGTFFGRDVEHLRRTIRGFRPDIVFAVERPAAIAAARLEHIRVFTSFSLPMGKAFASNPEFNNQVNGFLRANGLEAVESVLDVFDWADRKVVPSSPELEPLSDDKVVYVGPFQHVDRPPVAVSHAQRKKIVAYSGSGGISGARLIRVLHEAFADTGYEMYVATHEVNPFTKGSMHVARWFEFNTLLAQALVYVHHGGQNSVVSGLLNGTPQIICAGKHYERRYNGSSVEQIGAGFLIDPRDFTGTSLRGLATELAENPCYAERSKVAGEKLLHLGGIPRIVEIMEEEVARSAARDRY